MQESIERQIAKSYRKTYVLFGPQHKNDRRIISDQLAVASGHKNIQIIVGHKQGISSKKGMHDHRVSSVRVKIIIWFSGLRWAIEQCFEENKIELSMDHYEDRKYMSWHNHNKKCMLAHFLLRHIENQAWKKITVNCAVAD